MSIDYYLGFFLDLLLLKNGVIDAKRLIKMSDPLDKLILFQKSVHKRYFGIEQYIIFSQYLIWIYILLW